MKLLENKTAIITGASRGIGKGIAEKFAQEGCNIAFSYASSVEKATALEKELTSKYGIKAKGFQSNAADFSSSQQFVDEVVKEFAIDTISPGVVRQIVETAIQYSIEFDLLVPLYDQIKVATVDQMRQKMSHSKMVTGKRLGFSFNSDDV